MNGNKTIFIKIMPQSLLCVVISYCHILPKNCLSDAWHWLKPHWNYSLVSLLVTILSNMNTRTHRKSLNNHKKSISCQPLSIFLSPQITKHWCMATAVEVGAVEELVTLLKFVKCHSFYLTVSFAVNKNQPFFLTWTSSVLGMRTQRPSATIWRSLTKQYWCLVLVSTEFWVHEIQRRVFL